MISYAEQQRNHTLGHFMQETSLQSYEEIKESLGEMETKVYEAIKRYSPNYGGSLTDREIADSLRYSDPNKVRPRRNRLAKMGVIIEKGKRVCSISGKNAIIWGVRIT